MKGTGLAVVVPGRGAAFGDLFNDGKIDVVINPVDGPPVLLSNVNPDHHHWVEMGLVGGTARESARAMRRARRCICRRTECGMRQDVLCSGSYISANDRRLHFGLGDATDAGTAEIHWPSGAKETVKIPRWIAFTRSKRAKGSQARCAAEALRDPKAPDAEAGAKK